MNTTVVTCFNQDECSCDVTFDRVYFAMFTFVNVRSSSHAGADQDVRRLDFVQDTADFALVFHPDGSGLNILLLLLK